MVVKKIFLSTLLIIGIVLLAVGFFVGTSPNVTADDKIHEKIIKEDTSDFLKEKFNDKYGIIKIKNASKRIVDYSLIENTEQCSTYCEAEGRAVLYKNGNLFTGVEFEDINNKLKQLSNVTFWIKVDEEYEEDIPIEYEEICVSSNNSNMSDICYDTPIKWEKQIMIRKIWNKYNYEELKAGNYEWKLTANKEYFQNVDFILESNGEKLTEWAWWNGTGGTITFDGDYTIHTFTSDGTFNLTGGNIDVEILVVAGGGGSNGDIGGGAGGGGLIYNPSYSISIGSYSVVIGAGGTGGLSTATKGENSSFSTLDANGGGIGAKGGIAIIEGGDGGSGGGGGQGPQGEQAGGSGTAGQGFDGGTSPHDTSYPLWSSGGGGAGEVGEDAGLTTPASADGGDGLEYNISGTPTYYAGGGGGSVGGSGVPTEWGDGGLGGGGHGGDETTTGTVGTTNTGGGAGGGGGASQSGVAGGSGIVIIRYLTEIPQCTFSGFVFDEQDNPIEDANITIWNQFNVSEFYETTSDTSGEWVINVTNSTDPYMAGAYFNNTIIGQLKPFISGIC